jgi:hypothetical protein
MKDPGKPAIALTLALSLAVCVRPQPVNAQDNSAVSASGSTRTYTGRWDLTVRIPTHERPSWIEISESRGGLAGLMVGLWGHATPTGDIRLEDGQIEFTAPEREGFPEGTVFKGRLGDGVIAGTATARNGASWR